jgi:hypothetical protein
VIERQERQVREIGNRLIMSITLTIVAILLTVMWFSDLGLNFVNEIMVKSGIMLITNTIIEEIASTIEPEEIQKFRDGINAIEEEDLIQVHRIKNCISAEEAKEPVKRAELLEEAVRFSLARRQLGQQEDEDEAE